GRLTVGLGAGWHQPEHEGYGYGLPPVKERMDRLSEGIRVIRALFSNGRSTFDGAYYHLKDAANYPQPVQSRVPLPVGRRGEPRQVIDTLAEYVEAGAQRISVAIRPPVDWDALQSYIEEVMPAFR